MEKKCQVFLFCYIFLKYEWVLTKIYINLHKREVLKMLMCMLRALRQPVTDHLLGWHHKPKSIITSLINGLSLCTEKHKIHFVTQQASGQIWYFINTAFASDVFFCQNGNLSCNRVEPQCIIQSDESWDTLWARPVCGGMYSTSLHIMYSHLH